jgi:hypothetical protein
MHSAKKFFAESQSFGSGQRNLCRVFICLLRVFLVGSRQRSHFDECFFLAGVFLFALSKAFFPESFVFDSRQRREL